MNSSVNNLIKVGLSVNFTSRRILIASLKLSGKAMTPEQQEIQSLKKQLWRAKLCQQLRQYDQNFLA